ncbi:MAG: peptidoglycan-associated lipoprotein Pal [Rhodocyclaceae bacterium]|nr:peptidoglycan-associated lipoprotein Pal [Rhodocyclaceae bacterium]
MRKLLAVTALASALLAGCGSTPMSSDQAGASVEDRNATSTVQTPPVQTVTPGADGGSLSPLAELQNPDSPLSRRSVYFDFDSFVLRQEFQPLVELHARFLLANASVRMLIQGNADERGSREYNLALGQKRADALRRGLTLLGVPEDQIESVSLGEEKPRCIDSSEDCWAENRRADMLYSGEF